MPPEGDPPAPSPDDGPPLFAAAVPPSLDALPAALARARRALDGAASTGALGDTVELVLAEALTNIVRHARPGGPIRLVARAEAGGLAFLLEDDGRPLPGGRLPAARAPSVDVPSPKLPEGGFGLVLIRALARDLAYDSAGGRNRLTFRVETGPGSAAAKMP